MVVYTFNSGYGRHRQAYFCEFKSTLVYRANSRASNTKSYSLVNYHTFASNSNQFPCSLPNMGVCLIH